MALISDEMLVAQTLAGDMSAFEEIVDRYKNTVFAIVYRMLGQYQEAEDVAQDVFLTVYQKLYQFDQTKKFAPWINRIAVNTSISTLRKKNKVITINFDEAYIYDNKNDAAHYNPEKVYERKEILDEIKSAIEELPESYKTVIILRYQMDYSNQEIADILEVSRENVEVKVHRARKALRKIIIKKWDQRGAARELPTNKSVPY